MVGDNGNWQCELRMQPPSVSLNQTIFDAKPLLCGQHCCMFVMPIGVLSSFVSSGLESEDWFARLALTLLMPKDAGNPHIDSQRFFWGIEFDCSTIPPDVDHRRYNASMCLMHPCANDTACYGATRFDCHPPTLHQREVISLGVLLSFNLSDLATRTKKQNETNTRNRAK